MKQVNLLPQGTREKAAQRRLVPVLVLAVLAAVAGVGAAWFITGQELSNLKDQVAIKQAADQAEAARVAKDQQSLAIDSDLVTRVAQINTLSQHEVNWSKAFALVSSLLPNDVTLSGYTYSTGQGTITLQLTGTAASNLSFANFVESLQGAKQLQSMKVDGFTYDPVKGTVSFTISATVQPKEVIYPAS